MSRQKDPEAKRRDRNENRLSRLVGHIVNPGSRTADVENAIEKLGLHGDMVNENEVARLMETAANGSQVLLDSFLKRGANVNAVDNDGYSAIGHAITAGRTESLVSLLEYGASLTGSDLMRVLERCRAASPDTQPIVRSIAVTLCAFFPEASEAIAKSIAEAGRAFNGAEMLEIERIRGYIDKIALYLTTEVINEPLARSYARKVVARFFVTIDNAERLVLRSESEARAHASANIDKLASKLLSPNSLPTQAFPEYDATVTLVTTLFDVRPERGQATAAAPKVAKKQAVKNQKEEQKASVTTARAQGPNPSRAMAPARPNRRPLKVIEIINSIISSGDYTSASLQRLIPDVNIAEDNIPVLEIAIKRYAPPALLNSLLDRGANISVEDNSGCTALFCAIVSRHTKAVLTLLRHGATPTSRDLERGLGALIIEVLPRSVLGRGPSLEFSIELTLCAFFPQAHEIAKSVEWFEGGMVRGRDEVAEIRRIRGHIDAVATSLKELNYNAEKAMSEARKIVARFFVTIDNDERLVLRSDERAKDYISIEMARDEMLLPKFFLEQEISNNAIRNLSQYVGYNCDANTALVSTLFGVQLEKGKEMASAALVIQEYRKARNASVQAPQAEGGAMVNDRVGVEAEYKKKVAAGKRGVPNKESKDEARIADKPGPSVTKPQAKSVAASAKRGGAQEKKVEGRS